MAYFHNSTDVNQTFIIESLEVTGDTTVVSACTAVYTNRLQSCDDSGTTIFLSNNIEVTKSIIPLINATSDLGSPSFRFRNVNTVSGFSTVWSSSEKIITPKIDLGIDSEGNHREITADNSIFTNDIITGGDY